MVIASIAYRNLEPTVRSEVVALIKLNPYYAAWISSLPKDLPQADRDMMLFELAATWADAIKADPSYVTDGTENGNRPDKTAFREVVGYKDRAKHKYWHFIDLPFSEDGTPLQHPPFPNLETALLSLDKSMSDQRQSPEFRSYALVWVLHLVGDAHQPLHTADRYSRALPQGDQGGNLVKVCEATCAANLHGLWNTILGTEEDPRFAAEFSQELPKVEVAASDLNVPGWIEESFELAKGKVYAFPIGNGAGPFDVTPAYRERARLIAEQQAYKAGLRLANLLNTHLRRSDQQR
jgi:hypothetical protein